MDGKENFYLSTRFWVFVLTPVTSGLLLFGTHYVPFLKALSEQEVTTFIASLVVTALTYILARTFRNTPN